VKINEGGQVTMKEEIIKKDLYTKEEELLGDELCDMMNADKELKSYFGDLATQFLKDFAKSIIKAYLDKDTQKGQKAFDLMQDGIKALVMHVYIKVMIKKKEIK